MEKSNTAKKNRTGRHPIYQAADRLKKVFLDMGFRLIDNGDGPEVEKADVTFQTWDEPTDVLGWLGTPLQMRDGHTNLRTRILPAHLRKLKARPPLRLLGFGRVYQNDYNQPVRHLMEGIVIDKAFTLDACQKQWQDFACRMFGSDAIISIEPLNEGTYRVCAQSPDGSSNLLSAYMGPANSKTLVHCGAEDMPGWVFVIDVDAFARQFFSVKDTTLFYSNDLAFLSRFASDEAAVGDSAACDAIDLLREMGYQETCGTVLYTEDTYKKMNMIQESWDKNNRGYPLVEPLGKLTATRTVLTPAIEETMGFNFKRGVKGLQIFEVGHIFLPIEGKILPKEHIAVAMGAYGPGVTIETFTQDVKRFLRGMGIESPKFVPTGVATAYKWNECMIIMNNDKYIHSNFGQINRTAAKNHGIGTPAYMANFELDALIKSARDGEDDD